MSRKSMESFLKIHDEVFWSEKLSSFFTFAMTAQYKSIRVAAKNMYISPQALNKQLSALEKKLDFPLFLRSPRGLQLTGYGEVVYDYTIELLQITQTLKRDLTNLYAEQNHLLRVAYTSNLRDTPLHAHMVDFQIENLQYKTKMPHGSYEEIMTLARGDVPYLTIVNRPSDTSAFHVTVLHKVHHCVLLPKNHPLAGQKYIDLDNLGETCLILSAELFRTNQNLIGYFTEKKIPIDLHLETGGFEAGLALCRAGKGIMLITDYVEAQLNTEEFVQLPAHGGLSNLEVVLLMRKNMEYSPLEHKFVEYMKAYSQE